MTSQSDELTVLEVSSSTETYDNMACIDLKSDQHPKKISNARASPSPVSQRKREESKRLSEQGCWFSSDPGELPARNAWSLSLTTPRLIEAWERAVKTVEWRLVYGFCDFANHRQRSLSLQLMRCQWQLLDCRQRTVEVFEDESLIEFSSRPCITVIGLHFTWSL